MVLRPLSGYIQQAPAAQSLLEEGLNLGADRLICVTDPGDVRFSRQDGIQGLARWAGYDDAQLPGYQLGTQIVWVAANAQRLAAPREG